MTNPFEIKTLMHDAAVAVVTNQQLLDQELGLSYLASCQSSDHQTLFSVPRTKVQLRFGVIEKESGGWRLVPFRWLFNSKREIIARMHTHELAFCVDAGPVPPPKIENPDPRSPIPLFLSRPYFLLSFAEEDQIKDQLIAALDQNNWTSAIPGGGDIREQVKKERKDFVEAYGHDDKERGPIFFRLDSTPVSYLIVRVVGKDANDSIFVLTPNATPAVVIYSLDGDEKKQLKYQPLHRLLFTIRRWQSGTLPAQVSNELQESGSGLTQPQGAFGALVPFASDIRDGYAAGLQYLAESSSTMRSSAEQLSPTTYYDLTNVEAALTYSVSFQEEGESAKPFDFSLQRTWGDDETVGPKPTTADDATLIESHVYIRAFHEANKPRVEIELKTPEFVLSNGARDAFIKLVLIDENKEKIVSVFEDGIPYGSFLENVEFQRRVVTVLSYRGEETKHKFLVIWPGLFNGQTRDFAFTCALDKKDVNQLKDVKRVLRVDQDLESVEFEVTGDQYRPFHNFFHAVRMWRVRMKMMK